MSLPVFKVSLLPTNLRPEESYIQLLDSLQQLQKISSSVFDKIDHKVHEQKARLQSVSARISTANAKIDHLRDSKKAIRVFASATFPADEKPDEYHTIFEDHSILPQPPLVVASNISVRSRFPRDIKPPQKLAVLPLVHIPMPCLHFGDVSTGDGLGDIPVDIKSVSSLLLFNTAQNPYSKSSRMDPLDGPSRARKLAEADVQSPTLDAAPASFMGDDQNHKHDDLNYIPGFGEIPEFNLPNVLPDLPGVFEDSSFGEFDADFDSSIPIVGGFTLDLPSANPTIPETSSVRPPPPPPVMNLPVISLTGPVTPATSTPPPPPPPPVLVPGLQMAPPPPPPPASGTAAAPAPSSDARSSLLESIRAAGGTGKAGLKSVKEKKIEQKKKKQEEKTKAVSGGGDLMDDLRSRLTNLRKGISKGNRAGDGSSDGLTTRPPATAGFGSAMDHVSSLIPHSANVGTSERKQAPNDEEDWD